MAAPLAGLCAAPAHACDCRQLFPDNPRFAQDVEEIVAYYPVAAEGVIERDGDYGWRFRTGRQYRGPVAASYPIQLLSDCSVDPIEMGKLIGKPIFLLLSEGQGQNRGTYEINRCVNLQSPRIEKAIRDKLGAGCGRR